MTETSTMPTPPEEFRAVLRAALSRGVRMTPLCRAVIGWLCGTPTAPAIAHIRAEDDGRVWLRLTDEAYPEPTGTFLEFLGQVHVICVTLGMTENQAREAVAWAQTRLF